MTVRIPTNEEYITYDGAHTCKLWNSIDDEWVCPACQRSKFQILRWTKRNPGGKGVFWGWLAPLHTHHDHLNDSLDNFTPRFDKTIICDQCNSADGAAKKKLKLPRSFSFSPEEIRHFIEPTPHAPHKINFDEAEKIFSRVQEKRFFKF